LVERVEPLGGGRLVRFSVDVPDGSVAIVRVEQRGIDAVLSIAGTDNVCRLTYASEWNLPEWALFDAGHYDVTVQPDEPSAGPGTVRIGQWLETHEGATGGAGNEKIELQRELTRGACAYGADDLEPARTAFVKAAQLARGIDQELETLALINAATLQWATGHAEDALTSARAAFDLIPAGPETVSARSAARSIFGLALSRLGRYAEARATYLEALGDLSARTTADAGLQMLHGQIRSNLCVLHLYERAFDLAETCLTELLATTELKPFAPKTVATIANNLGGLYYTLGRAETALEYFRRALASYVANGQRMKVAGAFINIGLAYASTGQLREALNNYLQAEEFLRPRGPSPAYARLLGNIGSTYVTAGDLKGARTYFTKALAVMNAIDDPPGRVVILRDLGMVLRELGEVDAALQTHESALSLAISGADEGAIGRVHEELSKDYAAKDDFESAVKEIEAAEHLLPDRSLDAYRRASVLMQRARVEFLGGRTDAALQAARDANSIYERIHSMPGVADACVLESDILRSVGRIDDAMASLRAAMEALDSVAAELQSIKLSPHFANRRHDVFERLIELTTLTTEDTADSALQTLSYSEQARTMTLRYALARSNAAEGTGLSALMNEYSATLARFEKAVAAHAEESERNTLLLELESLQHRLDGLEARVAPASILDGVRYEQLASVLDEESVAVEFFLGERVSHAWWVSVEGVRMLTLPPRSELDRLVETVQRAVDARSEAAIDKATATLSEVVLEPLVDYRDKTRLLVVADGSLSLLPFSQFALPARWVLGTHVIDGFEVVHLPALSSLGVAGLPNVPPALDIAILADPLYDAKWPRLPGTRVEAGAIEKIFVSGKVRTWSGTEASLDALLSETFPKARVLHLATHGIVVPGSPHLTGLILSGITNSGHAVPSFLGVHLIPHMPSGAYELVVLSACQTAASDIGHGDGTVSLARAFLYAGSKGVIATTWRVSDVAAMRVITEVYRQLSNGTTTSAHALRQAQLSWRRQGASGVRIDWRSFVYFGDWRAAPFSNPYRPAV
jgi:CHAT domain-containing protein/Flp pilus assembly protein TadD